MLGVSAVSVQLWLFVPCNPMDGFRGCLWGGKGVFVISAVCMRKPDNCRLR